MITKNNIIWLVTLLIGVVLLGYSFIKNRGQDPAFVFPTPTPSESVIPSVSPSKPPLVTKSPAIITSCELKGEIKFLASNLYDNQDAKFIYKGIDQPGRNIFWTIIPQDDLTIGPNIFSKLPLPDGESLLGIVLPKEPKYKRYELTARIQYGQLIDGTLKVLEKPCTGKTTVVLP